MFVVNTSKTLFAAVAMQKKIINKEKNLYFKYKFNIYIKMETETSLKILKWEFVHKLSR